MASVWRAIFVAVGLGIMLVGLIVLVIGVMSLPQPFKTIISGLGAIIVGGAIIKVAVED